MSTDIYQSFDALTPEQKNAFRTRMGMERSYAHMFFECDGPPRAYFELTDGTFTDSFGGKHVFRGVYETVGIYGPTEEECWTKFDQLMQLAYQPNLEIGDGDSRTQFCIWRRRPTAETRPKHHERDSFGPAEAKVTARVWISNWTFASLVAKDETGRYVWTLP